jgi:hypothetical protein
LPYIFSIVKSVLLDASHPGSKVESGERRAGRFNIFSMALK